MGIVREIELPAGVLYIWHITESLEELSHDLLLSDASQQRLSAKKYEQHQKAFLAVRQILRQNGISDCELSYDDKGKPRLRSGLHISISHSFDYALVAISQENIGIDIELKREKIIRLKDKFCNPRELALAPADFQLQVDYFTEVWSVKEALYKMCNSRSLSFAQDMSVCVFEKQAEIIQADFSVEFTYKTFRIDDYVLVVSQVKRVK
ncbi:4'-phosphopantetheinyl transferase superfamily protein [Myroides sp. DF42-4-2]|uniref:4'-phosphopantetheinyl transferase family protein n=1 Tax=unclassified Myroides TaxID=2642485 RepID=UPI002577590F|nr:4'-phosphopantetheinyl transferase superfamily protein [Myroides sp. DF42-4-2]